MKILTILLVILILLFLGSISVDAQRAGDHNEGNWPDQFELFIFVPEPNKNVSANGLEEAKMYMAILNKATNHPDRAQSDVEVWLSSENDQSILEPQMVTISEGEGRSEDISLRSKKAGTVTVTAIPVGIFNSTSTTVTFVPPEEPSALFFEASPKENIPADGSHSVKLTVKLLYPPNNQPYVSPKNISIDTWTDKGDQGPQIIIAKDTRVGQGEFTTYKVGTVNITAKSYDFNLEDMIKVTFISIITKLTLFLAAVGGLLGGFVKYIQENKKDGSRLNMIKLGIAYLICGVVLYIGAALRVQSMNEYNIPIESLFGVFLVGFVGGFVGFVGGSAISFLNSKFSGGKNEKKEQDN